MRIVRPLLATLLLVLALAPAASAADPVAYLVTLAPDSGDVRTTIDGIAARYGFEVLEYRTEPSAFVATFDPALAPAIERDEPAVVSVVALAASDPAPGLEASPLLLGAPAASPEAVSPAATGSPAPARDATGGLATFGIAGVLGAILLVLLSLRSRRRRAAARKESGLSA